MKCSCAQRNNILDFFLSSVLVVCAALISSSSKQTKPVRCVRCERVSVCVRVLFGKLYALWMRTNIDDDLVRQK